MRYWFALLGMGLFSITAAYAADITVQEPYARVVPPGAPASAAFMKLHNNGDSDRKLVSASSDIAEVVELHTHIHDNGVMRMRPVENIEIPAGEEAVLQPGGLHIMLINLKKPMAAGDKVTIDLQFDDGSHQSVEAEAREVQPTMGHDMSKMKH